jgi:hypothetical protein
MNIWTRIGVPRTKDTKTAQSCLRTGIFSRRRKARTRPRIRPDTVATPTINRVVGKAESTLGKKKSTLSHEKKPGMVSLFVYFLYILYV